MTTLGTSPDTKHGFPRWRTGLVVVALVAILVGSYAALAYAVRRHNIQGIVVLTDANGQNAKPVANAEVKIRDPKYGVIATLTTDANGKYSARVAPGTYLLKVTPCPFLYHRYVTISLGLVETRDIFCAPLDVNRKLAK